MSWMQHTDSTSYRQDFLTILQKSFCYNHHLKGAMTTIHLILQYLTLAKQWPQVVIRGFNQFKIIILCDLAVSGLNTTVVTTKKKNFIT